MMTSHERELLRTFDAALTKIDGIVHMHAEMAAVAHRLVESLSRGKRADQQAVRAAGVALSAILKAVPAQRAEFARLRAEIERQLPSDEPA